MRFRVIALLLALVLILPIIPAVSAAPTPTTSVNLNADYRYTLTGLPSSAVVQNFFFDGSTLYVTQHGGSGITYLSRLSIQGDKAVYQDHMTLNNCGRGESLAGYYYNNKLYFYVGCKIDTAATTNYSTQMARVPYEAGKTYNYTQLDRFNHLNYASKDGSRLGTLYRINACGNSQYTIFRVQTSEGSVTYSCYDTKGLNELLDANQSVNMSEAAPKSELIYSFTQTGSSQIVRPNSSFQGVELASKNVIFTCGGAGDVAPMIGKMNSAGTYQCQATIANVGTSSINGLQSLNGKLYFAIVGDSTADGQKIYSIDLMNMGVLPTVTDSAGVSTLHQLPCMNPDTEKNDYQQNMSYVIRTSKGKTIVIDGGWSEYDGAYLFTYLQKITGQATPHIDAWFLSHPHGDHYGVLLEFANTYASQVTVDAFYHRMPTAEETEKYFYNADPAKIQNAVKNILNKVGKLKDSQGNATRIVSVNPVHSGKCNSSFDFDEVHFDILMTVEDLFWGCDNITTKYSGTKADAGHVYTNETIAQLTADNLNNSSVAFRVTMGGKTILFLGDAAQSAGIMLKRYHDANKADNSKYFSLKSDIVQIAHHGTNNVQKVVYQAIDADIALWPTPKWDYNATADYSITQYYTRQWCKEIGTVDYVSGYGPHVLYFPVCRTTAYVEIPEKVRPYVFDAEYYAEKYPDLKTAYGTDEAKLYNHFIEYGIEEGRCASPFFDVAFYTNQNDYNLRYSLHGDYVQAFYHFVNHMDLTEELSTCPKQLSPLFDTGYYAKAYPELASQGLDTEFELLEHFALIGYEENRLATDTVVSENGTFYHQTCNIQQAQAPTCTQDGYTQGITCTICGQVLEKVQTLPATGHSYTYEGIDTANHAVGCKDCDYAATESHVFENGSCVCGKAETVAPLRKEDWKLYHSLNLASDISVNYVIPVEQLAGFDIDSVYVECRYNEFMGNEVGEEKILQLKPELRNSYYYFTLEGLTAIHMTNELKAVLHGVKDGQAYFSPTDEYSIAQYAYSQLSSATAKEPLKILCADLLRYGAAVQNYKGYRTDSLADGRMTAEQKLLLTDLNGVSFQNVSITGTELAAPTVSWLGKALDLNTKVTILYVVNVQDYSGDPTGLSLRVCYTDYLGQEAEVTLTDPQPYSGSAIYYCFRLDSLLAAELRTVLSAQVYKGETPVSNSMTYTPDTYGNGKTGALGTLCKALFAYSDSAKAYFLNN